MDGSRPHPARTPTPAPSRHPDIPDTPEALLAACRTPLDAAELLEGTMICWRCGAREVVIMPRGAWQALPIVAAVDRLMTCSECRWEAEA